MEINTKELEIAPLDPKLSPSRDKYRTYTGRGRETIIISIKSIDFRENLNSRIYYGDIPELGMEIYQLGLQEPITVDAVDNERFLLEWGERRVLAHRWLTENGYTGFDVIEAWLNKKDKTDLQRLRGMVIENNSTKPFEPIELGMHYAKMLLQKNPETGELTTAADIARWMHKSKMHVSDMLRASKLPAEVIAAISKGQISATAAIDLDKAGLTPEQQVKTVEDSIEAGQPIKVEDVRKLRKAKQEESEPVWDPIMGEEIEVKDERQLSKFIGRIFAWPVYQTWKEDFVDEDTAEVITIDRNKKIVESGDEFTVDTIDDIISGGIKIIRLRFPLKDNKPLDNDEIYSDENNAEMDHQEKGENGLLGSLNKPKSQNLIDILTEISIMYKGLHHIAENSKMTDNGWAKFVEQSAKLGEGIGKAKAIAEHLK